MLVQGGVWGGGGDIEEDDGLFFFQLVIYFFRSMEDQSLGIASTGKHSKG